MVAKEHVKGVKRHKSWAIVHLWEIYNFLSWEALVEGFLVLSRVWIVSSEKESMEGSEA